MDQILVLLSALKNPAAMSSQQWLLVFGMLILLLGGVWLAWRLYCIIVIDSKSSYVPNIGRKRLEEEAQRKRAIVSKGSSADSGSAENKAASGSAENKKVE
jgi:hypothetical protein